MSLTDLDLALQLADLADSVTLPRFSGRDLTITRKPDATPVTDADLATEDAIRAELAHQRPQDIVAGEERGGLEGMRSPRAWLLDPIDGTKNYLRGVPVWATSIALLEDGIPVVGVLSAPALGRRWWAARGAGAWRRIVPAQSGNAPGAEPERIRVSAVDSLADAYVSTTNVDSWTEHEPTQGFARLAKAAWESRAFGDFWQHCLVAEGVIDVAVEPIVSPWDVAALQVIVEEAGGKFTDLESVDTITGGNALSTNGRLHDAALRAIHEKG